MENFTFFSVFFLLKCIRKHFFHISKNGRDKTTTAQNGANVFFSASFLSCHYHLTNRIVYFIQNYVKIETGSRSSPISTILTFSLLLMKFWIFLSFFFWTKWLSYRTNRYGQFDYPNICFLSLVQKNKKTLLSMWIWIVKHNIYIYLGCRVYFPRDWFAYLLHVKSNYPN